MTIDIEFCIRLVAAGAFGSLVGLERELRGKSAGIRTHLLVSLGSCLLMIISAYGFPASMKFDATRIAAGIVGGLGFLGGGIIMKNRQISGLTTAAGIWVTGAIGMTIGCGLYYLAVTCMVIQLICMEAMHLFKIKGGDTQVDVRVSAETYESIEELIKYFGKKIMHFSINKANGRFKADISLLIKKKEYPDTFLNQIKSFPSIELESME